MYLWPHAIEGIHVEGEIVYFSIVDCNRTVGISIKFYNRIYKFPYSLVVSMENMGAIFMYIYSLYVLTIYITTKLRAFLNYKNTLSCFLGSIRKCGSIKTRADN